MFLPVSVCLSVCLLAHSSYERILVKFFGVVGHGQGPVD